MDLKKLGLLYWARIIILFDISNLDFQNTRTTLLHSAWFYNILDLDLKSARIALQELDWFQYILDLN